VQYLAAISQTVYKRLPKLYTSGAPQFDLGSWSNTKILPIP